MELLELQARARAIRSQLALEPVTKIELDDSDSEIPDKVNDKDKEKESRTKSAQSNSKHSEKPLEDEPKVPATKPVRLKRNFRQRQMEGYESDGSNAVAEKDASDKNEKGIQNESREKSPDKVVEKEKSPEKVIESTIPNDDDVVPIVAEPEILCISSDSENDEKKVKEKNKTKKSYITMPVIEKVVRPPTGEFKI